MPKPTHETLTHLLGNLPVSIPPHASIAPGQRPVVADEYRQYLMDELIAAEDTRPQLPDVPLTGDETTRLSALLSSLEFETVTGAELMQSVPSETGKHAPDSIHGKITNNFIGEARVIVDKAKSETAAWFSL